MEEDKSDPSQVNVTDTFCSKTTPDSSVEFIRDQNDATCVDTFRRKRKRKRTVSSQQHSETNITCRNETELQDAVLDVTDLIKDVCSVCLEWAADQMDCVLTRLVQRRMWGAAMWLLQSAGENAVHNAFVGENPVHSVCVGENTVNSVCVGENTVYGVPGGSTRTDSSGYSLHANSPCPLGSLATSVSESSKSPSSESSFVQSNSTIHTDCGVLCETQHSTVSMNTGGSAETVTGSLTTSVIESSNSSSSVGLSVQSNSTIQTDSRVLCGTQRSAVSVNTGGSAETVTDSLTTSVSGSSKFLSSENPSVHSNVTSHTDCGVLCSTQHSTVSVNTGGSAETVGAQNTMNSKDLGVPEGTAGIKASGDSHGVTAGLNGTSHVQDVNDPGMSAETTGTQSTQTAGDQPDDLTPVRFLTQAVKRGLWSAACALLHHISQSPVAAGAWDLICWTVGEACQHADDDQYCQILSVCPEDQENRLSGTLATVLSKATERGLWKMVGTLLGRISNACFSHIGDTQRRTVKEACKRAVEEVCKHADDDDCKDIVEFCADDQLAILLTETATRGLWQTVARLLKLIRERAVTDANYAVCKAVEEVCKRADDDGLVVIGKVCDRSHFNKVFQAAVEQNKWGSVGQLSEEAYTDSRLMWAMEEACKRATDTEVRNIRQRMWVDPEETKVVVRLLLERGMEKEAVEELEGWSCFHDDLSWLLDVVQYLSKTLDFKVSRPYKLLNSIKKCTKAHLDKILEEDLRENCVPRKGAETLQLIKNLLEVPAVSKDLCAHFIKWCYQRRGQTISLCQLSLPLLLAITVNTALQSVLHRAMWEETRRWFLQFLVDEKLWDIVKAVADHSVYDDQRAWALSQARLHKQWDVVVVLADHGLTDNQRYRVYRQVAKYADWATVRLLFERAVDMRRVCEELMAGNPCRERPPDKRDRDDVERRRLRGENVSKLEAWYRERSERVARLTLEHNQRCTQLNRLEEQQAGSRKDLESLLADTNINWYKVLSQLRQDDVTGEETEIMSHCIEMTLQRAVECQAWYAVTQLVRLGVGAGQRDWLFPETIRQGQWGVARTLLEQGVSVEASHAALQKLMEERQWLLVARVMELSMDDTERLRVMEAALDKREGSVVAHGISVMESRVSEAERQAMYEQAVDDGTWQTVKRLVEEKDRTGQTHRDRALVAAVKKHRWDVVEHCVLQGADINKPDADGDTMLHQSTRQEDWDGVEGLVCCGANPNLTDRNGYSAFHTTVNEAVGGNTENEVWDAVKTSVQFHGNLNHRDPEGYTQLYKLTSCAKCDTKRVAEILDCALWWGSDVAQREDSGGKTALHTVCEGGRWDIIQYVVARGVDPLCHTTPLRGGRLFSYIIDPLDVTYYRQTALALAVGYVDYTERKALEGQFRREEEYTEWEEANRACRQKLVAECIRLGVSTHQPPLTDSNGYIELSLVYIILWHTDLVVLHMLYESGACSHRELLAVSDKLDSSPTLFHLLDQVPRRQQYFHVISIDKSRFKRCVSYLKEVASTPRSLQSTCRLVISHHLGASKPRTRQKMVKQLRLPDRWKNYVLFSDLMDPFLSEEDVVAQMDAWGCNVDDVFLPPHFFDESYYRSRRSPH